MITAREFAAMPLLMRRGQVLECGLSEMTVRTLASDGTLRSLCPTGKLSRTVAPGERGSYRLFLKSSVAPLLRLPMDWAEFESWGALLTRHHLERCGLWWRAIEQLVESGQLDTLNGHGPMRFYRNQVAEIVGYDEVRGVKGEGRAVAMLPRPTH